MNAPKTETGSKFLRGFLGEDRRFAVPLYQRQFSWDKTQLDEFWQDLEFNLGTTSSNTNFLGTIVLQIKHTQNLNVDRYQIIDGQQRITTFFLTLFGLIKRARESKLESMAIELREEFVQLNKGKNKNRCKLVPAMIDQADFNSIIKKAVPDLTLDECDSFNNNQNSLLTAAFEITLRKIDQQIENKDFKIAAENADKKPLEYLMTIFLDGFELVEVCLHPEVNAHDIFEKLNTMGQPLKLIDLVRNLVLEEVHDRNNQKAFIKERWEPFQSLLTGKRPDRSDPARDLTDTRDEEKVRKKIDSFFFPYALMWDEKAKKTDLFNSLKRKWDDLEAKGHEQKETKAQLIVDDMNEWVPSFLALNRQEKPTSITNDFWEHIKKLVFMNVPITAYPFLMNLVKCNCEKKITDQNSVRTFRLIESYIIRRVISGRGTSGFHTLFKGLWKKTKLGDPEMVADAIKNIELSMSNPTDEEFKKGLEEPVYKTGYAKYILVAYEDFLRSEGGEHSSIPDDVEVDHIMPQHLRDKNEFSDEDHEKLLHTIGNLAIMSSKLNKAITNKPFEEVQIQLENSSIFLSTKEISENKSWTPDTIQERTQKITEFALKRWQMS